MPLVVFFILERGHFLGVQFPDRGEIAISSDECRPSEQVTVLGQTMGFGKLLCFCNDPFLVLALQSAPSKHQTHLQGILHNIPSSLRCWYRRSVALQLDLIQMLRALYVCHVVTLFQCLAGDRSYNPGLIVFSSSPRLAPRDYSGIQVGHLSLLKLR
jgi:hypothetical protein